MKYIKSDNIHTLPELMELENNGELDWKIIPHHGFSFGHVTKPVWMKLSFHNPGNGQKYHLSFLYTGVDSLEMFVPADDTMHRAGMRFLHEKQIPGSRHYFPVYIKSGQTMDIYLKADTKYNFFSTSWVIPEDKLLQSLVHANFPNILFLFVCLLVMGFNTLYYYYNKKKIHLYFTGYVFFLVFSQIEMLGYSWIFGIEDFRLHTFFLHASIALSIFFNIYFIIHLFELENNLPILAKMYRYYSGFSFAGLVFYLTGNDSLTRIISSMYILALFISYYYVAFYFLYRKRNGSLAFIIFWSMAMIGYSIYALNNLGVLPLKMEYIHTIMYLGTLEILGIFYLIPSTGALSAIRNVKSNIILRAKKMALPEKFPREIVMHNFTRLLEKEKLFLDENANLALFAKKMHIPPHILSRSFNEAGEKGFRNIINEYRIKHAMELMQNHPRDTILSVLHKSGFNSKATFNRVFREITGMTPQQYKTQIISKKGLILQNETTKRNI